MVLTELQKIVLKSLALNGPQHIQQVQQTEGITYSLAHRSIRKLEDLDLVWLSYRDENRGAKSAQIYSLTPYGVVEAVLNCEVEDQIETLIERWGDYSPYYIKHWEKFRQYRILNDIKNILHYIYPDVVKPLIYDANYERIKNFSHRLCIVYKNILDSILFYEIFDGKPHPIEIRPANMSIEKSEKFFEIILSDREYLKNWKRWFTIKKIIFSYLKKLNNKADEKLKEIN